MRSFTKYFGSLSFALFLIAALSAVLVVSTLLESAYGSPFVQRFFYQAGWFDVFLTLVGLNILCSALNRWPFKKHHTGFLLTHLGILVLLAGSLSARLWGMEGRIALTEGEAQSQMEQSPYELVVHAPGVPPTVFTLKSSTEAQKLKLPDPNLELSLDRITNIEEKTEVEEGPASVYSNHAVQFRLSSQNMGSNDTFWLMEKNPFEEYPGEISIGGAVIRLRKKAPEKTGEPAKAVSGPVIRLLQKDTGKELLVPVPAAAQTIPLGDGSLKITNIRYFPEARVGTDNKLMTASDRPLNPAVTFDLENSQGQKESYTKFALFPDFESIHGKASKPLFNVEVELLAPAPPDAETSAGPSLTFYIPGSRWTYLSKSNGGNKEGNLETGKTYETGWMDFTFHVEKILDRALVSKKILPAQNGAASGKIGAEIALSYKGRLLVRDWAAADRPLTFDTPNGPGIAAMALKKVPLPFRLSLRRFRKVDYPGTEDAASYESDVTLEDASAGLSIQKTISMNHPLDYKGYRIFQSSYSQDPSYGSVSIFTVANNPGIWLIYFGSVVMFLGIILVFYVQPFSSLSQEKKNDHKEN